MVKREDIINGDVRCPKCSNIVPIEDGCNMVTCQNHSPYVHFCVHCKHVNDNGIEYVTCGCSKRNTKETRTEAQIVRNNTARQNPVVLT